MTAVQLPVLPAPFTDCRAYLVEPPVDVPLLPVGQFLREDRLTSGIKAITEKWGPGDWRAAASLWTQGYFMRLLRPVLAFGVLANRWHLMETASARISISELDTAAGFALRVSTSRHSAVHELLNHVETVSSFVSQATSTSSRLHRSNGELIFWRAVRQLEKLAHPDTVDALEAITEVILIAEKEFPYFGKTLRSKSSLPVERRVCCLRYLLDGLEKCKQVCPLNHAMQSRIDGS